MKPTRLAFILAVVVPIVAGASFMNVVSRFSVQREAIIKSPPKAGQLVESDAGGYFILGDSSYPEVSRTDQDGGLLWTYQEPQINGIYPTLEAAASAPDGGVLLCGWRRRGQVGPQAGLLIRLDKDGHEMWRLEPSIDDQTHTLVYFKTCVRVGNDFIVIGDGTVHASEPGKSPRLYGAYVLLKVRADGSVIWQKDINLGDGGGTYNDRPLVMSNGDLVFRGAQHILRIDRDGNLIANMKNDKPCYLLQGTEKTDSLQMICDPFTDMKGQWQTLSPDLRIIQSKALENVGITTLRRGYELADGTMLLLGSKQSALTAFIPTVWLFSSDGSLLDSYHFYGVQDKGWISDGMLTESDGELVTLHAQGNPESHTVMTFLRRK